jgi:PIN domain nuclease of toxin-antitoxin system
MKFIIDSHILIWSISEKEKLSERQIALLTSSENEVFVCSASFWEISIKLSLGKFEAIKSLGDLFTEVKKSKIQVLEMQEQDYLVLATLPFFHKDPFDRAIISMAMARNIPVISDDQYFEKYEIQLIK